MTLAFLKPCCQRWSCFSNLAASDVETVKFLSLWRFGRRIRVTQANRAIFFREKANSALIHIGQQVEKTLKALHHSVTLKSVFAAVFLLLVTPYYQSVKLWGGFGHLPLEIPIANELAPSRYQSRMSWLWGGFGEALGGFGRLCEGFGELWETLGESLGSLWEALGKLWESFRAFLLLAPSLPPLYIKNK